MKYRHYRRYKIHIYRYALYVQIVNEHGLIRRVVHLSAPSKDMKKHVLLEKLEICMSNLIGCEVTVLDYKILTPLEWRCRRKKEDV